ncbi:phospholipid-binding protein [candidate division MSBL1 archaeon SCGC-AAA259E19]|uniref:Phospholipid-binding protein n=1 Tax=candidate division MSBL1 archaeon SCGC-AAA259E19 TaxID=1698264 RepID=A0A133UJF4_9EURY|nr:phospholipid-binding protein [candidate division MSBL1 archaeon SCGC-AAA259E19]
MSDLKLKSPAFSDGEPIPDKYGLTEENVNPPLEFEDVPEKAESLVLLMDDPDAVEPAGKVWDHWVLWNIDPDTAKLSEGSVPPGATEGKTDFGKTEYGGPNPPDREHAYRFRLYALDTELDLPETATKKDVEEAMEGRILAEAELTGTYTP